MQNLVETEIGKLPQDWEVQRLDSSFTVRQGKQVSRVGRIGSNQHPFLRTRNVLWGRLDLSEMDTMHFSEEEEKRLGLHGGDLLVCEGGDVGRTAIWNNELERCYYQNHLHRLRAKDGREVVSLFMMYWLWYAFDVGKVYFGRGNVTTIPNLSQSRLSELLIPIPPRPEQKKIAYLISTVHLAIEQQEQIIRVTTELKKVLMQKLFTEGLRGEPQKQTEIGPMPESWNPTPLGKCCDIISSSISYTEFLKATSSHDANAMTAMGVKVSDMNLPGNETRFIVANLIKPISVNIAKRKLIPLDTVVFPKRGAAIATNKKRLTTTWTVLDPNLIGVRAKDGLCPKFLFYWFQTFDLRSITDPGPTPQLNKKDLFPVLIPVPNELVEQEQITKALAAVDSKIRLHESRAKALQDLFRTLLHQLMTAQIRVHDLNLRELEVETKSG